MKYPAFLDQPDLKEPQESPDHRDLQVNQELRRQAHKGHLVTRELQENQEKTDFQEIRALMEKLELKVAATIVPLHAQPQVIKSVEIPVAGPRHISQSSPSRTLPDLYLCQRESFKLSESINRCSLFDY
uniref:TORC_N domain-containing protein n=1 Tax=Bursaphelenchus xylophilus TaxID=6326 RepID=A0A1I7SVZ1_BURXY